MDIPDSPGARVAARSLKTCFGSRNFGSICFGARKSRQTTKISAETFLENDIEVRERWKRIWMIITWKREALWLLPCQIVGWKPKWGCYSPRFGRPLLRKFHPWTRTPLQVLSSSAQVLIDCTHPEPRRSQRWVHHHGGQHLLSSPSVRLE